MGASDQPNQREPRIELVRHDAVSDQLHIAQEPCIGCILWISQEVFGVGLSLVSLPAEKLQEFL